MSRKLNPKNDHKIPYVSNRDTMNASNTIFYSNNNQENNRNQYIETLLFSENELNSIDNNDEIITDLRQENKFLTQINEYYCKAILDFEIKFSKFQDVLTSEKNKHQKELQTVRAQLIKQETKFKILKEKNNFIKKVHLTNKVKVQ